MHDVIVVGGGYASMAAALQLVRARRTVLVIDAGARRNRFAGHAHGFLGRDGVPADRIATEARAQLAAYPDLSWIEGEAIAASGGRDGFAVTLRDGRSRQGRRILFATGVRDTLPAVEGIEERWGRSVFHCPYCHGYELERGRIGVIGSGPMSSHQAELLAEWGTITFFPNGALALENEARETLKKRGIAIEDAALARIEGAADLRLADGRVVSFAGLFVAPRVSPASAVAVGAGCALEETPMGTVIRTDAGGQTSIPGIYACGDVASVPHSISLAVGSGAMAGAQVHRSLIWPDA